ATLESTVKAVLSGNLTVTDTETIDTSGGGTETTSSAAPATGGSPSAIVNDAETYNGDKYVFGGTPGTTKGHNNGTDCSGFVNMVVGRDLGLPIPGFAAGKYNGGSHGPPTQLWLLWDGAKTIDSSQTQPGDLACFL